jgi:predicted phosphodiesterase
MRRTFKILFLTGIVIFMTACNDLFDYSPYAIDFEGKDKDVNKTNMVYLNNEENDSSIRIAFTGDTHRFYDEFNDFVGAVNHLNKSSRIDFVIHVGDIADFGLPKQYLWGNSYLLKLDVPYFVVPGNHDMVGNGGLAYLEMFGEFNFSFIYNKIKFVFVNTNSREFSFSGKVPDIDLLDSELRPSGDFDQAVVIFHVPPMDADFDPELEESFHSTLAKYDNVLFVVHGHRHHYEIYQPYSDSITYVNVYGVEYRKFNVINISDGSFEVETYEF